VEVDASSKSVGAVCSQWQNGRLRVVEFTGRILTKAEEAYCVTRKEMLAIIFALKHFRCYLLGLSHFSVVTDHKSLEFFDRVHEPVGQMARYLDFQSDFNLPWNTDPD